MNWMHSSGGIVGTNLNLVYRWVANSDGSVDLHVAGVSSPLNVPGIGTDAATASEAMRRITQALDPANY